MYRYLIPQRPQRRSESAAPTRSSCFSSSPIPSNCRLSGRGPSSFSVSSQGIMPCIADSEARSTAFGSRRSYFAAPSAISRAEHRRSGKSRESDVGGGVLIDRPMHGGGHGALATSRQQSHRVAPRPVASECRRDNVRRARATILRGRVGLQENCPVLRSLPYGCTTFAVAAITALVLAPGLVPSVALPR